MTVSAPLPHQPPAVEILKEGTEGGEALPAFFQQFRAGHLLDILFGVVDIGGEVGADPEELLGDAVDFAVEGPVHRATGRPDRLFRAGADQVGDRFRLGQGELAV